MRRLSDANSAHERLLSLPSGHRLFVQRWIELFDEATPIQLRARPVSPQFLHEEKTNPAIMGFHRKLIDDEIQSTDIESLHDPSADLFEHADADPVQTAERVGAAAKSGGFHDQWLFRAYQAMLPSVDGQFIENCAELLEWWRLQKGTRPISVAVPIIKRGHIAGNLQIRQVKFEQLSPMMRRAHGRAKLPASTVAPDSWLLAEVRAADPAMAWENAHEAFARMARAARRSTPPSFEDNPVLIDDRKQLPEPRGYAFKPARKYRFPTLELPAASDRILSGILHSNHIIDNLWNHYSSAMLHLEDDDTEAAFDDIVKCLDISYEDYNPPPPETKDRPAKRFVLNSARLLTLEWPHEQFGYVCDYLRQKSVRVIGQRAVGDEMRKEEIARLLWDNAGWSEVMSRCSWDELLNFRRSQLLDTAHRPGFHLSRVHARYTWDLARAVRARNNLFHQGTPLLDTHSLAIMVAAVRVNLLLRCQAAIHGFPFNRTLHEAKGELAKLAHGSFRLSRGTIVWGWRTWETDMNILQQDLRHARE